MTKSSIVLWSSYTTPAAPQWFLPQGCEEKKICCPFQRRKKNAKHEAWLETEVLKFQLQIKWIKKNKNKNQEAGIIRRKWNVWYSPLIPNLLTNTEKRFGASESHFYPLLRNNLRFHSVSRSGTTLPWERASWESHRTGRDSMNSSLH